MDGLPRIDGGQDNPGILQVSTAAQLPTLSPGPSDCILHSCVDIPDGDRSEH